MARTLCALEVREILHELVQWLAERGDEATIYVIGGAAVALANPDRTATQDIDGYIRRSDATEVLEGIQRERGLEAEWFNWHVHGLQPPVAGPELWREILHDREVVLYAANTDALLAMKLNAARAKDTEEIVFLLRSCGVTSLARAEEVYEHYYPGDALTDVALAGWSTPLRTFRKTRLERSAEGRSVVEAQAQATGRPPHPGDRVGVLRRHEVAHHPQRHGHQRSRAHAHRPERRQQAGHGQVAGEPAGDGERRSRNGRCSSGAHCVV